MNELGCLIFAVMTPRKDTVLCVVFHKLVCKPVPGEGAWNRERAAVAAAAPLCLDIQTLVCML